VAELGRRLSAAELTEWMAFYHLEPWGGERSDLQAGIIASTVANVNRDSKKKPEPYRPQDFIPQYGPKKEQTLEEQVQLVTMYASVYGTLTTE
jgi:hypothetical protein